MRGRGANVREKIVPLPPEKASDMLALQLVELTRNSIPR